MAKLNPEVIKALEKKGELHKHAAHVVPVATTVHVALPTAIPSHLKPPAIGASPTLSDSDNFPALTPGAVGGAALKNLHQMRTALSDPVKAALSKRLLGEK